MLAIILLQNNLDTSAAHDENIKPQASPEKYAAPPKVFLRNICTLYTYFT